MFRKYLLQIIVLASVLVTILVNSLANILPINGYNTGELSDDIPIFFVPAGYVFSIWGLIYLSLIVYSIYTFLNFDETDKKIFPFVIISGLANIIWIFLWHYKMVSLSVIFMLILLASLLVIYVKTDTKKYPLRKRFAFQIYLGWVSVATIANIAGALSLSGWSALGLSQVMWSAIMIGVATILGILIINLRKDYIYPLVLIWAIFGILYKFYNVENIIVGAAVVSIFAILSSLLSSVYLSKREITYRKEEN